MISPPVPRLLVAAAITTLVACSSPTTLRVDTDPQGADVESNELGYLGVTPLERRFTGQDMRKVGRAANVNLDLTISKRGYVSVKLRNLTFPKGTPYALKKTLEMRLEEVAITTDPEGVGVFQLILDDDAPASVRTAFDSDPAAALKNHPRYITQRFIGNTPTSYRYDHANPLEQNDPMLFQKAGYQEQIGYFKSTQERLHRVMVPTIVKER